MGWLLGDGLRGLHQLDAADCPFDDFLPDKLINMVKENLLHQKEEAIAAASRSFPGETIEHLIDFLEKNKPAKLVFTHGDYGSGNVMIHGGVVSAFIDVGGAGISDPYYDIYYLTKSLTVYTGRSEEIAAVKEGYGVAEWDERSLRFHHIIDVLLL
ncbi:aminoglycoside phosphotransferase APH(3') [Paenibacillus gorillae]|uniref:aminoglycoside phosphotransferase APH(3') n=1 Tax=Paenibacillus gorillae TaxID=1243662 RepID=UPI0004B76C38|nr:aminoglycoside phosphotransferase APH(3') [Paenibacillus gorillae]